MKVRVTLLTENDKHVDLPKEELEKEAKRGWDMVAKHLTKLSGEKMDVEKVEVVEE